MDHRSGRLTPGTNVQTLELFCLEEEKPKNESTTGKINGECEIK